MVSNGPTYDVEDRRINRAMEYCIFVQTMVFVLSMIASLVSAIRKGSWKGVSRSMTLTNIVVAVAWIYYGFSVDFPALAVVGCLGVVCSFVVFQLFFVFPGIEDNSAEFKFPARLPIFSFNLLGVDFAFCFVTLLLSLASTGHTTWYSVMAVGLLSIFAAHCFEEPLYYLLFLSINTARILVTGFVAVMLLDRMNKGESGISLEISNTFGPSIHLLIGGTYGQKQPELSKNTLSWFFLALIAGLLFFCIEQCLVSNMLGKGLRHGAMKRKQRLHPSSNSVGTQCTKEDEGYGFHNQSRHSSCDSISVVCIPAEKRKWVA